MVGPKLPTSGTSLAGGGMWCFCSPYLQGRGTGQKNRWSHFIRHQVSHSLVFLNENRESTLMPLCSQAGTKSLISIEEKASILLPLPLIWGEHSNLQKNGLRPSKHRFRGENNEGNIAHTPSQLHLSNNIVTSHVYSTFFNHRYIGRTIKIPAACKKLERFFKTWSSMFFSIVYWTNPLITWIPPTFAIQKGVE